MSTSADGSVHVVGKFKEMTRGGGGEGGDGEASETPEFKLSLNTDVSNADFQMGYSMTGTLERGCRKEGRMEMTHYAMIKRKGYWSSRL